MTERLARTRVRRESMARGVEAATVVCVNWGTCRDGLDERRD